MVVNHEAGAALLECVASLRAEGVVEVTVVDNASSDGSTEALVSADGAVRLVQTGTNLGYGAAANRGIDATGLELVLVSNPDVAVHRGALAALVEVLGADPVLAVAGPRILEADGTRYPSARRFPSLVDAAGHALLGDLAPDNRFTRRYRMGDLASDHVTEVDWVSGACFLARRRALEELGGFDESYFMYAEDTDLCWRARRAGWGVVYVPDAVVTHVQGISTAASALPDARRPSPLGLPLRGPDREGVAPAGAARNGRAPGACASRSCVPGRPWASCAAPRAEPSRVGGRSCPGEIPENGWRAPVPRVEGGATAGRCP